MVCSSCGAIIVENVSERKEKRVLELALGFLGGILGIISGFVAFSYAELFAAFANYENTLFSTQGLSAVLFSILGIIGAILANKRGKLSGLLMITAAIGGLISISWTYLIPFVLLMISGVIGLVKENQNMRKEKWLIWVPLTVVTLVSSIMLNYGPDYIETQRLKNEINLMMEDVQIEQLTYNIDSFYYEDEIGGIKPNGTYIIFVMAIRNDGLESKIIDTQLVRLIGEDGSIYEADPIASTVLNKQDQFKLNALNPKISVNGSVAFDVPDKEMTYEISVRGGLTTSKIKLIKMAKRRVTSQ